MIGSRRFSFGVVPLALALGVAASLVATAFAAPASADDYGALNPAAPPETAQYSFLIGKWNCQTRSMRPDQSFVEGTATWTGRYVLDGWAIEDLWISALPQGGEFQGKNIRSFNRETGKWDNRWLPQGTLQWKYFESEMVGETMVMIGKGEDARGEFVDRNTFFDITPTSWKWRKDRSYDGGENWLEGVGNIEATLASASASASGSGSAPVASVLDSVEHGFVDSGGVKIHYAEMGSGPLVVMLHGFPDYWYTWRDQMAAMAGSYHVVAIDLRGYNQSDQPSGVPAYAMTNLIGDVAAVIRHFDEGPAVLIGHDWGGAIAWLTAAFVPNVVDRLVILSTPHPSALRRELSGNQEQKSGSDYARRFQEKDSHKSLTAEGLVAVLGVEDAETEKLYLEAFRRSSFEGMMAYYKANYPRSGGSGSGSGSGSAGGAPPTPKIKMSVLAIHGLDDQALHPKGFDSTWEFVESDVTLVSLPGVGHWVQREASDKVTATILSWLAE